MIYSRLGRVLSRSAFHRNIVSGYYGGRLVPSKELVSSNACIDGGLGLVRGYLTSIGAGTWRQPVSNATLSEFSTISANPRLRRLFCSEAPKIRKESNTGDRSSFQEDLMKPKQISFEEFKNKLLEPGLVDYIMVTNKGVAKVYVKSSPSITNQTNDESFQDPTDGVHAHQNVSHYKYYLNIGVDFIKKLKEAEEALGRKVPVGLVIENWIEELTRAVLLLGILFYVWRFVWRFVWRLMQGGLSVDGPGGKSDMGKAQVTSLD